MKPRAQTEAALTLFEVLIVIASVVILALFLLPALRNSRYKALKITCAGNLMQVSFSYRIWAGDHGALNPMCVSVTNGGSMELVTTGNAVLTYQVMSNELCAASLLYCPADRTRTRAADFPGLVNSNISYFIGVDVTNDSNPMLLLSGDSHFQTGGKPVSSGLALLGTNPPPSWTPDRHNGAGNIGMADGSVQSATSNGLAVFFENTERATNRLAMP